MTQCGQADSFKAAGNGRLPAWIVPIAADAARTGMTAIAVCRKMDSMSVSNYFRLLNPRVCTAALNMTFPTVFPIQNAFVSHHADNGQAPRGELFVSRLWLLVSFTAGEGMVFDLCGLTFELTCERRHDVTGRVSTMPTAGCSGQARHAVATQVERGVRQHCAYARRLACFEPCKRLGRRAW
jgi:hypothetical protein